jgi:hypothetical protein
MLDLWYETGRHLAWAFFPGLVFLGCLFAKAMGQ